MNKKLNLVEILKDAPKGTKLYSPLFGKVSYERISVLDSGVIVKKHDSSLLFLADGRYFDMPDSECLLFPAKDQRDWSKFSLKEIKQTVEVTIHPLDPVLVRDMPDGRWALSLFYKVSGDVIFTIERDPWNYIIPFTAATYHLLGTTDPSPIDYRIQFSQEPRTDVYSSELANHHQQ